MAEPLLHRGGRRLGKYYPPDRIVLDRRVLDHLGVEPWAEWAVRHESVHALTGSLAHDGPGWACGQVQ